METVKLNNGSEEPRQLVETIMKSLRQLIKEKPGAFHDLVVRCDGSSCPLYGDGGEELQELPLIQDENGEIHDSVKNVVLSATVRGGVFITLVSPFAGEKEVRYPF